MTFIPANMKTRQQAVPLPMHKRQKTVPHTPAQSRMRARNAVQCNEKRHAEPAAADQLPEKHREGEKQVRAVRMIDIGKHGRDRNRVAENGRQSGKPFAPFDFSEQPGQNRRKQGCSAADDDVPGGAAR